MKLGPTTAYEKVPWHDDASFNLFLLSIALIAAVTSLGFTILLHWHGKNNYWSFSERIHYRFVVLSLLAFIWWLNNWNLLGFRF